jgi:membrane-anchored protein YejM (alkaline phosphatase superfamily)
MKPGKLNHTFMNRLSLKESWVIFFILGLIMLDYPFLSIFDKPIMLLGFPLTFIYIFAGWGISILVIYLFTISIKHEKHSDNGPNKR